MGIQRQISKKKKKALVGRKFDLLLEGESEETELLLEGRTAMHAPEIDGKVFVNDFPEEIDPQPGQFYRCQITEAHDYDLGGENSVAIVLLRVAVDPKRPTTIRIVCRASVPSNSAAPSARSP